VALFSGLRVRVLLAINYGLIKVKMDEKATKKYTYHCWHAYILIQLGRAN